MYKGQTIDCSLRNESRSIKIVIYGVYIYSSNQQCFPHQKNGVSEDENYVYRRLDLFLDSENKAN